MEKNIKVNLKNIKYGLNFPSSVQISMSAESWKYLDCLSDKYSVNYNAEIYREGINLIEPGILFTEVSHFKYGNSRIVLIS